MRSLSTRIIVTAFAVAGCQAVFGIHGATLSDGGPGQPCNETNNDNPSPCATGVCVQGICRAQCMSDLACADGERCLTRDNHGQCNPSCEGGCTPTKGAPCDPKKPCGAGDMPLGAGLVGGCGDNFSDCTCKGGSVCAADGQCRETCSMSGGMGQYGCGGAQTCVPDPTACKNAMGMGGGQCVGACYGMPPHDNVPGSSADGGGPQGSVFYDGSMKGAATSIAAQDSGVYFATTTGIHGCSTTSCGSPSMIQGATGGVVSIDTRLVWINSGNGDVFGCAPANGGCTNLMLMHTGNKADAIATHGQFTALLETNGTVSLVDDQMNTQTTQGNMGAGMAAIAYDGMNVYWTIGNLVYYCDVMPLMNCMPKTVPGTNAQGRIATESNARLFWVEPDGIWASSKGSQARTKFVTTTSGPTALATDRNSRVYWAEPGGAVKKCQDTMSECTSPTLIATGGDVVQGLAVNNQHVYWIANGKILRAPK